MVRHEEGHEESLGGQGSEEEEPKESERRAKGIEREAGKGSGRGRAKEAAEGPEVVRHEEGHRESLVGQEGRKEEAKGGERGGTV